MSSQQKTKKSSKEAIFTVLRQIAYTKLFKKYSSGDFSYNKISINNLVFNDTCLVVARFKDFLIYDDNTDFLRRFYPKKDRVQRLKKILSFYEKYSKIFPNYLVLKENKYLYRNIRKKQKMIDAFNEIKREEKENRKRLKNNQNVKNDANELFTKKVKNEIKAYQNNISFKNYKNSFDSDKNNKYDDTLLINQNSISIYYKQFMGDEGKEMACAESFIGNQTSGSISNIVNVLNDNKIYTKDLPNLLIQNDKQKNKMKKTKTNQIGIDTKNKINKKEPKKANKNHNSVKTMKTINNTSSKDDNENRLSKNIKNDSLINKKKVNDKNTIKYIFTSNNATNSSSVISKKTKNLQTSSSLNIKRSENNENKNIQNDNYYTINDKNNELITKINPKDSINNINQKTTPNVGKYELKKHYYKTNNNFKRNTFNKRFDKNSIKDIREKAKRIKDDNEIKERYSLNQEKVKKNYAKSKHIYQDNDLNEIYKMTENKLNKKYQNPFKINSNEIINTEKACFKSYKNFLTNNNPNLITGDTKSNERNEKNFMEDKVLVNVRDIINQVKDNKKVYYTAKKSTMEKNGLLTKTNSQNAVKTIKLFKTKKNYLNTIENKDTINESENNHKERNNSAITKQKTEYKLANKKFMTKEQKTKTKQIFIKTKKKQPGDKKLLLKSSETFDKTKKMFKNKKDNEKESNIDNYSTNRSNKYYEIKYESTLSPSNYDKIMDNDNERRMHTNLSHKNMKKHKKIFSSDQKESTNFKTKNHIIIKRKDNTNLNNSQKHGSCYSDKKYKSFLVKNHNTINNEFNYNSQTNILSINIINRIQAVKQNRSNNDFYRTLKVRNSQNSQNTINNNSSNSVNKKYNKNRKTIKTPILNNKKATFFKNHISKKLYNVNVNKTKEDKMNNRMSAYSIKVNKSNYNKDNEKIGKNKNLKKTLTKNIKKKEKIE